MPRAITTPWLRRIYESAARKAALAAVTDTRKAITPAVTAAPDLVDFPSRIAASLRVPVEEACVIARLQLDRMNAPSRAAATARQGFTRYPNTKPFVLGAASRLLRAAPSRDRRHDHHDEDRAR